MKPEISRVPSVKNIRKRYVRVVPYLDGWTAYLRIDHQSFNVVENTTKRRAEWFGDMLAIALKRMLDDNTKRPKAKKILVEKCGFSASNI